MSRIALPSEALGLTSARYSKEQIKQRQANTLRLGDREIHICSEVETNEVAKETFYRIVNMYDNTAFASSADEALINRYSLATAEYVELINKKKIVENIDDDSTIAFVQRMKDSFGGPDAKSLWRKIEYLLSLAQSLTIDTLINRKRSELLKMEKELFLTPLSRIRYVMKINPNKEEKDPLEEKGFDFV